MADPLSITASIIAVIQVTSKVVSLCYDYRSGLKDRSKEVKQLTDEITSLRDVLESILKLVEEDGTEHTHLSTLKLLTKSDGILLSCKEEMTLLEKELQPVTGFRAAVRTLKWPYARADFEKKVNRLGQLKSSLTLALAADHTSIALVTQENTKQIKVQNESLARDLESHHARDEYQRMKILIDAPDPSTNYLAAKSRRDTGSGEWLLNGDLYKRWQNAPQSLLWLHGIPGCGKTFLSSTIIDDLTSRCRSENRTGLAYFFFDFSTPAKQSFQNALKSVIMQLSGQSSVAWQILSESTESFWPGYLYSYKKPNWAISDSFLLKILERYLVAYDKIYLVLDALDESLEQALVLDLVLGLVANHPRRINILITSRQERNVEQALENSATEVVAVTAEIMNDDIRQHVKKRLDHDQRLRRWPETLRSEIEVSLIKESGGMLRWIDCQLDRIHKCLKPSSVKMILGSLPKTLGETYSRIIASIDEEYLNDALTVFQWLTYSRRTLHLDEVAEVLAFEYARAPEFSPEFRLQNPRDILSVCSSMITIGSSSLGSSVVEVSLAHASVRDFFVAEGANFGTDAFNTRIVHEKIAHSCLTYLQYLGSPEIDETSIAEQYPLAKYAAQNWMVHAKEAEGSREIRETAMRVLDRDELCYQRLLRLYDIDRPWRIIETELDMRLRWRRPVVPSATIPPLYYASFFGLVDVVCSLLGHERDINEVSGFFGDALSAAASQGHENIVKLLLRIGANANTQAGFQRGALMASAAAGHEGIVRLLLEKGANARETHFREGSALILAIRNGHERVVQCLIEAGVNVDEGDAKGPSTISIAAFCGQGAIVKMLLMAGAQCSEFTIQSAAQNSHESIVELLRTHLNGPNAIDHDVSRSVSARSGPEDEQTLVRPKSVSLWSAAAGGLESEVRRLLDCGTDPDSYKFLQRGTALSLAAGNGHASIVELLLQRGADINLQPTSRTLSPLDAAAKRGHLTVVRNLLCAQPPASTVVKAEFCGNPLESAAYSGNIAVLREILECKADVNAICAEDRFGGTALTAAARIGHEGMVELLLDQGAE